MMTCCVGVDLPVAEPETSQGKLQSELTELSSTQGRGRLIYPDQSAAAAQDGSTGPRRQPVDTGSHHMLVSEEALKENNQDNRSPAAAADGINGQNYGQPTVDSGQRDGTPLGPKSNQGMLGQNSHLKEKTEQDDNSVHDGIGHRPSETGSSYTDQLLAYGTMSGSGKKFQNGLDHGKYRIKSIPKEDTLDRDVPASGFEGPGDTRRILPVNDDSHLSAADRVIVGGDTNGRSPLSNRHESMQFSAGQGRMDPGNRWSSNGKKPEDRILADKDAAEKSQPRSPISDSRRPNHQRINEDGGQRGDQRIGQGSRLMKQNEDSRIPVHDRYGLSYMSGERPNVNAGETRQEPVGYHQASDLSEMTYSDVDIGKAKDAGGRPALVNNEQEARRYRPLDPVDGSRHQLAGMNGDPRNHKPLMGLTSSKDSSDIVKDEHRGYYDADGHLLQDVLPERNEYDKTGSKMMNVLTEHDGYERHGPKSVDAVPEHIAYDRQGAKTVNVSQDQSRYERPGSKSVDVLQKHGNYERQGSKSVDILPEHSRYERPGSNSADIVPDHSRYERPGSKSGDVLPERSDYEEHGSKPVDAIPEQSGYRLPGLKSSDVLPERVLYERPPGSKLVNVVPEHARFDRPSSKLLHPGGKDGMFHGKDHYSGGSSVYGTYDNGNYEDEAGNPNYGMWLKAEDQSNEPGYVDPRSAMSDSADGYDRDGYLVGRLQPEGTADVYGPDYVQYYYNNNNNPGFMKNGRNYLHNGDYEDGKFINST